MKKNTAILLFIIILFAANSTFAEIINSVISSSSESNDLLAANAVDGKMTTRWSSGHYDPQWLEIDYGRIKEFVGMIIYWETAFGRDYDVLVSEDKSKWEKVYSTGN
ncbi:discoidin domain-containing protein, partial [Elusimicrobiota bacterium]